MTTFTRISENEAPTIYTSPSHVIAEINPMIYGGFLEYVYCISISNRLVMVY
jgi:alpha-N-arabinofuranosidase